MTRNVTDLIPPDIRTGRWLDIAIRAVFVVVVAVAAVLGWMVWSNSRVQAVSSPAGRAVENLQKIVRGSPGNPNARIKLAEALSYSGRTDEAVEQYQAALKLQPDYLPALAGLATVAMQRRDYKTAESYWLKVVGLLDTSATAAKDARLDQAYYGLGVTYVDTQRWEEAVRALKEALRIRSDASDTHYMLSVAYRELDYPDKQKEELLITLAFDPNNAQANYDLGLLALKSGDVPAAAELFRIAADRAPEAVELPQIERLAKAHSLEAKDVAGALVEARIAAALDPASVDAVRLVGQLSEKKGDKTRALNAFQRLLEMAPSDEEANQAIKRLSVDAKCRDERYSRRAGRGAHGGY
jgi:cytochrome c-type biogenesis protein CcmH/NrfG